jgi:hypothetical protein
MAIGAIGLGNAGVSAGAIGFSAGFAGAAARTATSPGISSSPSAIVSISREGMGFPAAGSNATHGATNALGLYGAASSFGQTPDISNAMQAPGGTREAQFDRFVLEALMLLILAQQLQQPGFSAIG